MNAIFARFAFWLGAAALLVGLGAGTVWYWLSGRIAELKADKKELNTQLQAAANARRAEQQISSKRAAVRQQRAGETAASDAKVRDAISANREWADQPLPQGVRDALE